LTAQQFIEGDSALTLLQPIWDRHSLGMNVIHEHEAVYHALVNGVGMDVFEAITKAFNPASPITRTLVKTGILY
jgi:hypothetical protein